MAKARQKDGKTHGLKTNRRVIACLYQGHCLITKKKRHNKTH